MLDLGALLNRTGFLVGDSRVELCSQLKNTSAPHWNAHPSPIRLYSTSIVSNHPSWDKIIRKRGCARPASESVRIPARAATYNSNCGEPHLNFS